MEPTILAPEFAASELLPADADLITGGCLLDIKVIAGAKNASTGLRTDELKKEHLLQVVAYVLFDTPDVYKITDFGIYSARYGNFCVWGLRDGLETMAGHPVDVGAERAAVWQLLGGN